MQALKGLVIGLGILVLLGMAALVYGLYQKAANPDFRLFQSAAPTTPAPQAISAPEAGRAVKPFGDVAVAVPEGCTITDMVPDGRRLYLHIGPPCERIVVVDVTDGAVLGTITVLGTVRR